VDSSFCIYYLGRQSRWSESAAALLSRSLGGAVQVDISGVVMMELLVGPLRSGDDTELRRVERLLQLPNVVVTGVSEHVLRAAAVVRAATNIKTPDALVVAAASVNGCTALVGNDAQYKRLASMQVTPIGERILGAMPQYIHMDDYVEGA
jgi:predicted nucleic acid-binding protein